ncbi:regulatory protein GemA [Ottowia oryzae]|uniref:Regulatory protein GemA n=1 Tax=Ottowia oryzae TaxID=2109914 RepID=A0A2S0MD44_9BURK|nr:regulatory protein GemA [Ottowia oryzae]AVO33681.1 regulatory protein GemA [Ottowia oryzae]
MSTDHIRAIHVLKGKLSLSDDDYRALLIQLTGHSSSKAMTQAQRRTVREHLQRLAAHMGIEQPATRQRPLADAAFAKAKADASPRERKVWALWHQLHRDGLVDNPSAAALNAWVKRQVGVDALRFCTGPQLDTLIEALKAWGDR